MLIFRWHFIALKIRRYKVKNVITLFFTRTRIYSVFILKTILINVIPNILLAKIIVILFSFKNCQLLS